MNKFDLKILRGTGEIVLEELNEKFGDRIKLFQSSQLENLKGTEEQLSFESEIDDIDEFRTLYSALNITVNGNVSRNLFRREWRTEFVPAGINPSLAYCLCRLAVINSSDIVFDPFCGGGTIPLTALGYFNPAKVLASDMSGKAVDITIVNLKNLLPSLEKDSGKKFVAFRAAINQLKIQENSVSKIITNPPYGVRTGKHDSNVQIYKDLFNKSHKILRDEGKIVLITQEKLLVEESIEGKFEIEKRIQVDSGGLKPDIFVLKKN